MKYIFAIILLLSCATITSAQKVAAFSIGSYGQKDYERFSFWSDRDIVYEYGKNSQETPVRYTGALTYKGEKAFTITFTNGLVLYAIPRSNYVYITDGKNTYNKEFHWWYEGPQNGRGTFCSQCAADEDEAIRILKRNYTK